MTDNDGTGLTFIFELYRHYNPAAGQEICIKNYGYIDAYQGRLLVGLPICGDRGGMANLKSRVYAGEKEI